MVILPGCVFGLGHGCFCCFAGSGSLSAADCPELAGVVAAVRGGGRLVVTGCARGLDSYVRRLGTDEVFSVSRVGGQVEFGGVRGAGAFAARSAAMLRSVAASGDGAGLVAWVSSPCPVRVRVGAQFRGFGSGTWGSVAYALGLGLPVVLFLVSGGELPRFGSWVPVAEGSFAGGWVCWP